MSIAIIGAGLAGLACADALCRAGHAVVLLDKSRGVGGRMSVRRLDSAEGQVGFDHGAQYMTARDPAFLAAVEGWAAAGHAAPWPAAGADAWVGVPSMNAPARALAAGREVRRGLRVTSLERRDGWWLGLEGRDAAEGPFEAAIVALPAEQAAALLAPVSPEFAGLAAGTASAPCWTLMAAYPTRLPVEADVLQPGGPIAWAARNSSKPGRGGPEAWVVQADADWSRRHLELPPEEAADRLTALFAGLVRGAMPAPLCMSAHRWRYAKSGSADRAACWDPSTRLGMCGDWLLGPRVENAFRSGMQLAAAIGPRG